MSGYSMVYYKKFSGTIDIFDWHTEIPKAIFEKEYVYLMPVLADSLEEVYSYMQGENWSPHGEAREVVLALGLSHTSMHVGDIVFDPDTRNYWVVREMGFMPVYIR